MRKEVAKRERGREGGREGGGFVAQTHRQTFVRRLIQRLVVLMREPKVGGVGLSTDGVMNPKLTRGS